jgi:MoaA/NifB/PqqE/SkfB family radical SAM enzyme
MTYRILYRGPLSSCNYACDYCPFAKTTNTLEELRHDEKQLNRFVDWIEKQNAHSFGLLFTPWGEALIHPYYQRALTRLSHMPHVQRVAIQTNLSGRLDWVRESNQEALALWTTYHPSQATLDRFLNQCQILDHEGIRYSVGIVGLVENFAAMNELRQRLSPGIYFWVNAYKDKALYYRETDLEDIAKIDPLFPLNNHRHASLGKACWAGETAFSVDGNGAMYRCHFIKTPLGNIYEGDFTDVLEPRACTNATCGCHIGYVHLKDLKLEAVFGDSILERIPQTKAFSS